jgi:hypothetical protein
MSEEDVLDAIENGESAYELLTEKIPHIERKWKRLNKSVRDFLNDVQKEFPDAQYYTASGGFNLMLGKPHADDFHGTAQSQLVALAGINVTIGDGDF